ncbi:chitooligosaccharidolytic beta-N-acetylglucosaminidase [Folsomia candida]|uniref:chitooligosaccharidolytic beta-N-acetylglucosaminidase n=1 Tax=Folsomia candida TaxID=158441 RepID=UPI000B8FFA73|nr:chitooligosaccharidolytic beta-N-acetylglucosaminidase [Folsomia candida]
MATFTYGLLCAVTGAFFLPLISTQEVYYQLPTPYSYACLNETCSRDRNPEDAPSTQSLAKCRLLCGEYRSIWPRPTGAVDLADELVSFKPQRLFINWAHPPSARVREMLQQAGKSFQVELLKMHPGYDASVSGKQPNPFDKKYTSEIERTTVMVSMKIDSPEERLTLNTNESYTMGVNTTESGVVEVKIHSKTYYGARHALETLSQLINYEDTCDCLIMVKHGYIEDEPAFPYRGLMVDTGHNYISPKMIKKTVDAMSYNKLNTLHWHVSDAHSFPFYSRRAPKMALYGAYAPHKIYYPDTIRDIVEYAQVRGIRVVPEIGGPARAGNGWQWGEREGKGDLVVCLNKEPWKEFCAEPPCGQLNPLNNETYRVMGRVYRDALDAFTNADFFHMGADDVNFQCWNSSDSMNEVLRATAQIPNDVTFQRLWMEYQSRALQTLYEASPEGVEKPTPIIWDSKLTSLRDSEVVLDPETYVIQIKSPAREPTLAKVINRGYKLIFSNADAWSLDCGFNSGLLPPIGLGPQNQNTVVPACGGDYKTWKTVYDNDPMNIAATHHNNETAAYAQVLGGTATMWTTETDDMTLEPKLWPRGSALAERLWSNPTQSWREAAPRLDSHRERLVQRGVHAEAVRPEWCYHNRAECELLL